MIFEWQNEIISKKDSYGIHMPARVLENPWDAEHENPIQITEKHDRETQKRLNISFRIDPNISLPKNWDSWEEMSI